MKAGAIDRVLDDAVAAGRAAGLVAVVTDAERTIYQGASGVRQRGATAPMTVDTLFRIASMTKTVTAVAAMQLVEQERLELDAPARTVLPLLGEARVLDGFDDKGAPILRAPVRDITLRHLLTHTSGYAYEAWDEQMNRFVEVTGLPLPRTGKLVSLTAPLVFDPGMNWEYGINIEMVGRIVETVSGLDLEGYFRRHILDPLGMKDTSYDEQPGWADRLAAVHTRQSDSSLRAHANTPPAPREFYPGGGGLLSTAPDYIRLLRALLRGGELDGVRILKPETVRLMGENHIGAIEVRRLPGVVPALSCDMDFFPGVVKKWGLSFMINTTDIPGRRRAGSLAWGGLYNSYFWLDPTARVAGVLLSQSLPFADPLVLDTLDLFERAVYADAS